MWVLSLSLFFCFVSFAPALSSPINQGSVHPVTLLDVRDIDTGNTGVLATPGSLSDYRPPVPYTWAVPGATASYIRLTRYGKDILAEDGYLFMLRLENIINTIIRDAGSKEIRVAPHHKWSWDRCAFEITMQKDVKAGDLLEWIVGFWRFMKKNGGYVEADMTFQTTHPAQDVGTATFRSTIAASA